MESLESVGHREYFEGKHYSHNKNPEWINGWTKAERESHCGWYDKYGRPNESINKIK